MSILSQIGVIILIIFIGLVIFYANKKIDAEAEKEERFSESWEEYQKEKKSEPVLTVVSDKSAEKSGYAVSRTQDAPVLTLVHLDVHHKPLEEVQVTSLPFTIGRSRENSLVLDDLCVARQHCKIVGRDGQFVLEDLGTTNKLLVKNRIVEECTLEEDMRFYIGNEEFLVKNNKRT